MADLRSAEVTSVPGDFADMREFIERHLRDHYEDLKQLKQMIDLQSGYRFRKNSSKDLIIEEFIESTQLWTDTGWKVKTMQ